MGSLPEHNYPDLSFQGSNSQHARRLCLVMILPELPSQVIGSQGWICRASRDLPSPDCMALFLFLSLQRDRRLSGTTVLSRLLPGVLIYPWSWCSRSEKAMAPHSSTLAWKIPWTEEPGGLQSMGSLWVRGDWATSFSLFTLMHWRRKWQPTPVFLLGESQGQGNLVDCHLWHHTESDTTKAT